MFTTMSIFIKLFNSVPIGWTHTNKNQNQKQKPKPKTKPKPKLDFCLYTYHIEDYYTHF
jgi:hypothetical protein